VDNLSSATRAFLCGISSRLRASSLILSTSLRATVGSKSSSTILYMFVISARGYFLGVLTQLNEAFAIIISAVNTVSEKNF